MFLIFRRDNFSHLSCSFNGMGKNISCCALSRYNNVQNINKSRSLIFFVLRTFISQISFYFLNFLWNNPNEQLLNFSIYFFDAWLNF